MDYTGKPQPMHSQVKIVRQSAIFLISLILVHANSVRAQTPTQPVSVKILIDSIQSALLREYIFPEKAKLMADRLKSQLKNGAYKSLKDPAQIKTQLEDDIKSAHKDGHLHLNYDPGFAEQLLHPQPAMHKHNDSVELRQERAENFLFNRVEILNGNIGYIQFRGFSNLIKEAKPTITSVFTFVKNTDAVIIDLRRNGGGSPWMVKQLASYFVKERTHLNDIYERKKNKTMEFWADPKDADSVILSMPVYILTSKRTFSAAEDFTYAMQTIKRATIVGETTGGGAHPTRPIAIGQGYVMNVPFARSINPITKTDWEGTGVVPDVPVSANDALDKAQELILQNKLVKATDDEQREQIQWSINSLQGAFSLTPEQWHTLEGRYEREGNKNLHIEFSTKMEKLILKQEWDGREVTFEPKSELEFFCKDFPFPLKFSKNDQGKITQVLAFGRDVWIRMN
jgi:hypothetical protein